jgi:hypothetical protein
MIRNQQKRNTNNNVQVYQQQQQQLNQGVATSFQGHRTFNVNAQSQVQQAPPPSNCAPTPIGSPASSPSASSTLSRRQESPPMPYAVDSWSNAPSPNKQHQYACCAIGGPHNIKTNAKVAPPVKVCVYRWNPYASAIDHHSDTSETSSDNGSEGPHSDTSFNGLEFQEAQWPRTMHMLWIAAPEDTPDAIVASLNTQIAYPLPTPTAQHTLLPPMPADSNHYVITLAFGGLSRLVAGDLSALSFIASNAVPGGMPVRAEASLCITSKNNFFQGVAWVTLSSPDARLLELPSLLGAAPGSGQTVPTPFVIVEHGIVHATPERLTQVEQQLTKLRQLLSQNHEYRHHTLRGLPSNWVTIGYGKYGSDYMYKAINESRHAVFRRY